jgi:hypothetical protein
MITLLEANCHAIFCPRFAEMLKTGFFNPPE